MFGLNKGCLTASFDNTTFIKGTLLLIIQFISSSNVFLVIGYYYTHLKDNIFFIFFQFCVYQNLRLLQSS
jgi:hypothetical protein